MVQWLRLCTFTPKGLGPSLVQELRSCTKHLKKKKKKEDKALGSGTLGPQDLSLNEESLLPLSLQTEVPQLNPFQALLKQNRHRVG